MTLFRAIFILSVFLMSGSVYATSMADQPVVVETIGGVEPSDTTLTKRQINKIDRKLQQETKEKQKQEKKNQKAEEKPADKSGGGSNSTTTDNNKNTKSEFFSNDGLVSGASMAATGIGGMELAQGLAERKADNAADADMAHYLQNFKCSVGDNGAKYSLGDKNVGIPGNDLSTQRSAYADLAYSIKTRKEALGLSPGIESEVEIKLNDVGQPYIESSVGLYDDVGTAANGKLVSRYRAVTGNEKDKSDLAADRKESTVRMVAGAGATVVGAAGGATGNVLMHSDDLTNDDGTEKSLGAKAASLFLGK